MDTIDLELITVTSPARLPNRALREIGPDSLTPLEGRIYVYRQMVPDLTDTETENINEKRRVPHLNAKGEPYVKRFVERIEQR